MALFFDHFRANVQCTFIQCTVYILLANCIQAKEFPAAEIEFFETKIRPVLAQECYECHSSRGKQKGGLVLDHRDGLLQGGDSGPAIEPGNAEFSLLMEALRHENGLEMPKAGVRLEPPIIEDFETWINRGAADPRDHPPTDKELQEDTNWSAIFATRKNWWSFQPIQNPTIPKGDGQVIDRFIDQKLRELNISPGPAADSRTIARRLYYSLIGLPPTPEQLENLDQNTTEQLVDTLLASQHFGEKWARHWMDWIRYAESHGSEGDPKIDNAHYYRDYLIRALNADIPYDQLLREHMAGDLLIQPRLDPKTGNNESVIGASHWRMCFHGFAPTDALDEKVRFTDDQINTFTKAFQSVTVSCARCHDHKFDAISQTDYYALFGILGSTRPGRKLIDPEEVLERNKKAIAELKLKIRNAIATDWIDSLDKIKEKLTDQRNWKGKIKQDSIYFPFSELHKNPDSQIVGIHKRLAALTVRKPIEPTISYDLANQGDATRWYHYGNGSANKAVKPGEFLVLPEGDKALARVFPSGVYSGLTSTKQASRFTSPDFQVPQKHTLWLLVTGDGNALNRYVVQNYPRSGTVYKIERLTGKSSPWHWKSYNLDYWAGDDVHIELSTAKDTPLLVVNDDRSWFGIKQAVLMKSGDPAPFNPAHSFWRALLDEPGDNIFDHSSLADFYIAQIEKSLVSWREGRPTDDDAFLLDHLLQSELLPNTLPQLPSAQNLIAEYRKLESEIVVPTRVPGLDEWAASDQPLFDRGNHKKPLEPVSRRFLEAVDARPYQAENSGRLQMAEDMLRTDNPFTRRVIVNRIWTYLFGNGIVGSVDNFGRLGEKPSHPELLDYLAGRFDSELGWSIKSLIKEIVLSDTWQRSSKQPESAAKTGTRRIACFTTIPSGVWKPSQSATNCCPYRER